MATNPLWRRFRARLGSRLAVPPAVAFATALGLVMFQTAAGLSAQRPQGPEPGARRVRSSTSR